MLDLPMGVFYSSPAMINIFYENLASRAHGHMFAGDMRFASDD